MRPPQFSDDPELSPWQGNADWPAHEFPPSATDLLLAWAPAAVETGSADPWNEYFTPSLDRAAGGAVSITPALPEEIYDQESANAAVDCLFRFLRALERRDTSAAMACVSPDYHTFEAGKDLDREALRIKIDYAFDLWRPHDVRLSLVEIPDPVFHPAGILIQTALQIDTMTVSGERTGQVLRRMAVFEETLHEGWLIVSLSDPGLP